VKRWSEEFFSLLSPTIFFPMERMTAGAATRCPHQK
jgi:hypothetical protein